MARKVDGTERSGRVTAPSAAGGFGGSDTALARLARPFVPKPFRSTGGMSTSADTMASINMGRHNIDEELPEDQVSINAIVSRKVSDRRYLPRKLKNMQYYLHSTPIIESIDASDKLIEKLAHNFELRLNEFVESLDQQGPQGVLSAGMEKIKSTVEDFKSTLPGGEKPGDVMGALETGAQFIAGFLPFGDIYFGYRAFKDYGDIRQKAEELEEMLSQVEVSIDMFGPIDQNVKTLSSMKIPAASDRRAISDATIKIAMKCYQFLTNVVTAIPFEIVPGLAIADTVVDTLLSSISAVGPQVDPDGSKMAKALLDFASRYSEKVRKIEDTFSDKSGQSSSTAEAFEQIHSISNFIGNLALVHSSISDSLGAVIQSDDPDVLAELRRRSKRRTDEFSGAGAVAGYMGPVKGPQDPKKFYNTMAKVAGSKYLLDPLKTSKPKP